MSYEIEKNIPCPQKGSGRPAGKIYPFSEMEVGDSFACPPNIKENSVAAAAHRENKKSGNKFVTRKVDGIIRCWRIS